MRALFSVFNKDGVPELAHNLEQLGWTLVSSGGTSKTLLAAGIAHDRIEDLIGGREILDGRIRSLHAFLYAGILADLGVAQHHADLSGAGWLPIDLVVCNVPPFPIDAAMDAMDIGGPAMLHAAVKNHERVVTLTHPEQYRDVLKSLQEDGVSLAQRRELAVAAIDHVVGYDAAVLARLRSSLLA